METCLKLRKCKDVVQMVADCIQIDTPAELACLLFNISQQPTAHTNVLLQQCVQY